MPNVQVVEEMVDMISASTAYRAAANAVMTVKTMAQRALDLATWGIDQMRIEGVEIQRFKALEGV